MTVFKQSRNQSRDRPARWLGFLAYGIVFEEAVALAEIQAGKPKVLWS